MDDLGDVVVIGAGQAGLAASHELVRAGLEHVVLERDRVGASWRNRWDTFCLVTPNWSVRLPGYAYGGDDPDGYMPRDDIGAYLEAYAGSFRAPVREGVDVTGLERDGDGFVLRTSEREYRTRTVVVSTGAYQRPHRPPGAETLPADLLRLDAEDYRNPDALPPGPVLVVGSGQSGCQIAEELREHGRKVFLACGRAPWAPRRLGGRDIVSWVMDTGFMDQPVEALPDPRARFGANVVATGRGGGHDLHLRTLRAAGVTLLGHFRGVDGRRASFAPDLAASVAWGDAAHLDLMNLIRSYVAEHGLPGFDFPEIDPFDPTAPEEVDLRGFGAVIFAGGFRPDYGSWIDIPGAFDDLGFPVHHDGASTVAPGLFFVGVHFLRTRKSSLLAGSARTQRSWRTRSPTGTASDPLRARGRFLGPGTA